MWPAQKSQGRSAANRLSEKLGAITAYAHVAERPDDMSRLEPRAERETPPSPQASAGFTAQ